jgi:hypothetical protein
MFVGSRWHAGGDSSPRHHRGAGRRAGAAWAEEVVAAEPAIKPSALFRRVVCRVTASGPILLG